MRLPASASLAMSPEQPMASSSACGARTTADVGRLDPNTGIEWNRRGLARVVAGAVVARGLVDQLVERDPGRPADRGRRVEHGQLLDRLGLLVQGAVDQTGV